MNILFIIDSLGSGGAQRQMCLLAKLLRKHGYSVTVLTYYPYDFFNDFLNDEGEIPVVCIMWKRQVKRFLEVRKEIKRIDPDVVIAFLSIPAMLAELAKSLGSKCRLIVSERDTDMEPLSRMVKFRYWMHRLADVVVTNSFAQERIIALNAPYLRAKLQTITNMVDLLHYEDAYAARQVRPDYASEPRRIMVLARVARQKNCLRFLEAVARVHNDTEVRPFIVEWYGDYAELTSIYQQELESFLRQHSLRNVVSFFSATSDVVGVLSEATFLCLPSLHEGCPNVVCEAMASGVPVAASKVGDSEYLLNGGDCGILFDPNSVDSITDGLRCMLQLSDLALKEMGHKARARADELLSEEIFLEKWCKIIQK